MASRGWEAVTPEQLAALNPRALVRVIDKKAPRNKPKTPRFDYADLLLQQLALIGLPLPIREHRPWTDRRFQIDLAWVDRLLFAECDGGEWIQGQHGRGQGMIDDCYKWNRLTLDGWTGFRFCGTQVNDGSALTVLKTALKS